MANDRFLNVKALVGGSRSFISTPNFAKVRFQLYNAPPRLTRHMNFGMIECKSLKVVAKVGEHCNGDSQGLGGNNATVTGDIC